MEKKLVASSDSESDDEVICIAHRRGGHLQQRGDEGGAEDKVAAEDEGVAEEEGAAESDTDEVEIVGTKRVVVREEQSEESDSDDDVVIVGRKVVREVPLPEERPPKRRKSFQ